MSEGLKRRVKAKPDDADSGSSNQNQGGSDDERSKVKWSIYLYKNGRTDVCLLVCGGIMEIQTHRTDLDEILHVQPHLYKEGFGAGLTPIPSPLFLKLKDTFLKNVYETKDVQQVAN